MNAVLDPRPRRRRMRVQDLAAVVDMEARVYSFPWSHGNFIDSLAAGYLAEVLECPQAGLLGYFVAMPGVDELHLLNITVAPAWQGRGYGVALLGAVQAHAQQLGMGTLWLEVRRSNQRARTLYQSRGFAEVGLRRDYYPAAGGREDAVVMRLDLSPGAPDDVV